MKKPFSLPLDRNDPKQFAMLRDWITKAFTAAGVRYTVFRPKQRKGALRVIIERDLENVKLAEKTLCACHSADWKGFADEYVEFGGKYGAFVDNLWIDT